MTGLVRRPARGDSHRARTAIEVARAGRGRDARRTVGLGTVLYALSIGPLVHLLLPRLTVPQPGPAPA